MSRIDVILPVKNGERFLKAALDSLARQTFQDFRLLACDDGSTDSTGEILSGESRFPVLVVRHETSLGVAASLNALLEKSEGCTYIARFDGDDLCHPERFARQTTFLEAHPEIGIVGTGLEIIDSEGRVCERTIYPLSDAEIRTELMFRDPLAHPALMIRAHLLRDPLNRYDPAFGVTEDYELWCRLSSRVRFANLPDPLLRYRRHGASVGVNRRTQQEAQISIIRRSYVRGLSLSETSRELLLGALGLAPFPASFDSRDGARVLAELDRLFAPNFHSMHYRIRRADIGLALLVNSRGWSKLRLLLADGFLLQTYLERIIENRCGPWRRFLARRRMGRVASRIRKRIFRGGGDCEPSLRVYGYLPSADSMVLGRELIWEHGVSLWFSSPEQSAGRLEIGDHVFLGFNTRLNVYADITIGRQVLIGANTYITSSNHCYHSREMPIQCQGFVGASVRIDDDVWVGCNVVVLPGVHIGRGAVIGAGSVVTQDVPSFEVWGGVPARKIKDRPA